jgi:hypothetical protein
MRVFFMVDFPNAFGFGMTLEPDRLSAADAIDFALNNFFLERSQRQREKQADSPVENRERFEEGTLNLTLGSLSRRGIGHAPPGRQGMSGPNRADFAGRPVAHGKHEVHFRRAGLSELVPTLAAQAVRRHVGTRYLSERLRVDMAGRVAPRAKAREVRRALPIQNCLGHEGARRISGAQEQNVEMSRCHIVLQRRAGRRQSTNDVDTTETRIFILLFSIGLDFNRMTVPEIIQPASRLP